ncbi:MAG: MFS transporter [Clostridia bacterium]|nr:MFS transporter [Clostridia bacterium]
MTSILNKNYNKTLYACCFGYIVQSVVNNFLPLLFAHFATFYGIPFYLISFIVFYNFGLQIIVDSFSANLTLKLGYRKTAILSCVIAMLGLLVLGVTSIFTKNSVVIYIAILISVTFMAVGGGITEVILSPLVEALPLNNKSAKMNLLHSFYCVGHILVVVLATLFFKFIGIDFWFIFSLILTLVPIVGILLFINCPIITPQGDDKPVKKLQLFKNKTFILFFIIMIMAGSMEQAVAQWISFYAEEGLQVDKATGDVIGVLTFATFMFISRLFFGLKKNNFNVGKSLFICALLMVVTIILSAIIPQKFVSLLLFSLSGLFVGLTWPGTYAYAGETFKAGGTVMFSLLALGGDIGCTLGPSLVGVISEFTSLEIGVLSSIIFPIIMAVLTFILLKRNKNSEK